MSMLPDELRATIVARHHTVARSELIAAGVPARDIERWRTCGVIVAVTADVFAVGDALHHHPFQTRAAAMSFADERSVCDPISSARVWRLDGVFSPSRPSFVDRDDIPHGLVVERADGIRALSPAATWLGLAHVLRPDQYERWSASIIPDRVSVRAAHDAVRRMADHRRGPELRAIRLLSIRRKWQRPHWSDHERRVRASLRRRGMVGLDGGHSIELPSGLVVHATAVDHRHRWAVEVDHRGWHRGRWSPRTEHWIDRQLAELGWTHVRVTDRQLDRDANHAMQRVVATHPSRATRAA